jgi:hypothetical protein
MALTSAEKQRRYRQRKGEEARAKAVKAVKARAAARRVLFRLVRVARDSGPLPFGLVDKLTADLARAVDELAELAVSPARPTLAKRAAP